MELPQRRLSPSVRRMWWTIALTLYVVLVVISVVVTQLVEMVPWYLPLILALAFVPAVVVPHVAYRRWRYEIRDRDLYTAKGAIRHRRILIPFDRIQWVETTHGPLDRFFGLAQVTVYTAAGKAVQIPGLVEQEAEKLREDLSRVAGTISV